MSEVLREALAAYAHEAWSGWMEYLFSKCLEDSDGSYRIPEWAVLRWQRQATTPYADLPEDEKDSDRTEAAKMLVIFDALIIAERNKYRTAIESEIAYHDEEVRARIDAGGDYNQALCWHFSQTAKRLRAALEAAKPGGAA